MIWLFTDFGREGPYVGQMTAVLRRRAPGVPVIDLLADAPAFDPRLGAYLLAALVAGCAPSDIVLAVVDPGVGGRRRPIVIEADGVWFVGPDNGLFEMVLRRARSPAAWTIGWRPEPLSASFHGRDLFAPVAARLALGDLPPGPEERPSRFPDWPDDLSSVVYVDRYGNAMTGLRATVLGGEARIEVAGLTLRRATTFGDVPVGEAFWYGNASGLAEIAVNGGSAAGLFGLRPGSGIAISTA